MHKRSNILYIYTEIQLKDAESIKLSRETSEQHTDASSDQENPGQDPVSYTWVKHTKLATRSQIITETMC